MQVLITGGAGFIGTNVVKHFASTVSNKIHIVDNLSRKGATDNLAYLRKACPTVSFSQIDVRDFEALSSIVAQHPWDAIVHLAGQVAVTTSTQNPRFDFESNALGTFNILESMRRCNSTALLIYASTNKVYGELPGIQVALKDNAYCLANCPDGLSENTPLDFHSPYGCSKGSADQYVIDYSRIYGLNTVSFRQSCIYGRHQYGIEDQGWVAWFTIAAMFDAPLMIYGDGMQTRDVLFVDDLAELYSSAIVNKEKVRGQAFNVGGGPRMCLSLLKLITLLEQRLGKNISYRFCDWRPGDQRVYISDIKKANHVLGWTPRTTVDEGIEKLISWSLENKDSFISLGLIPSCS